MIITSDTLILGVSIISTVGAATAYTSRSIGALNAKIETLTRTTRDLWDAFDEHRKRDDHLHDQINDEIREISNGVAGLQGKMGNGTVSRGRT